MMKKKTDLAEYVMETLKLINFIIAILFSVCYAYQCIYIPIVWFFAKKKKTPKAEMKNRFAVLICARNEEAVIADLIGSIDRQTYPADKRTVFVLADNCTDRTAEIAGQAGAVVYTRRNDKLVGKGYALAELLGHIKEDYPEGFDGYFVFDADNLLAKDYIEKMNDTFSAGNDIVTCYRNSKNIGDNWITAGYGVYFMRESRYLNHARSIIGSSCAVSGTGFLFSRKIAEELNGWPFHLLTEDIEFSADQIVRGRKIAFCAEAQLFDEQPTGFGQSFVQRMRWSKGYLQVFFRYAGRLLRGLFHGSFSCYDMAMANIPAFILSAASVICNVALGICGAIMHDDLTVGLFSIGQTLLNMYLAMFAMGLITTVTEWNYIHMGNGKKILYLFTFPIYMFTFIPISVAAIFVRIRWKPIRHTHSLSGMKENEKALFR